jgi:hypothetical protein
VATTNGAGGLSELNRDSLKQKNLSLETAIDEISADIFYVGNPVGWMDESFVTRPP